MNFAAITFYSNANTAPQRDSAVTANLKTLFNKYRDNPKDAPDSIGTEGCMRYLGDVGINLEDVSVFIVFELLKAPGFGELNREGFVDGWSTVNADTLEKQKRVIDDRAGQISQPGHRDLLKRVYKHTFLIGRPEGQKAVPLENAIEYWRLLLSSPSANWETANTPWLEWWIEFLQAKWKRTVNKDMWDQTFSFFEKSIQDEEMSFWSEDGAWPGVIDEFVAYVRDEKRGGKGVNGGEAMDVE